MHYNVFISAGQSNIDGRVPKGDGPEWIHGGLIPGVKVWNGAEIVDYSVDDPGQSGNGTSWALANSDGLYGFDVIAYHDLADTYENLLVCKVSSGGSRIAATGANDANGSWSANYDAIPVTAPKLLQALENRYGDLVEYLTTNDHTFTLHGLLWHQGEADSPAPFDYLTNFTAVIEKIRTFTNHPELPVYYGTISRASNQFKNFIKECQLEFAETDDNAYCLNLGNGTLLDPAHFDATTTGIFAEWVVDTILDEPVDSDKIPYRASDFFLSSRTEVDYLQNFLTVTGITDPTTVSALEYLVGELQDEGFWDQIVAIYPCVGGTSATNSYNLKNSNLYQLSAVGTPIYSSSGIQMSGSSYLSTGIILQDIPTLATNNFTVDYYSRTTSLNDNTADCCFLQAGGDCAMRMFSSFTQNSGRARLDLQASGVQPWEFILQSGSVMVDTLGLFTGQFKNNGELFKRGVSLGTATFNEELRTNAQIQFGYDGTTRFSTREYALLSVRSASANNLTYYNIIQQFQTLLGRQV